MSETLRRSIRKIKKCLKVHFDDKYIQPLQSAPIHHQIILRTSQRDCWLPCMFMPDSDGFLRRAGTEALSVQGKCISLTLLFNWLDTLEPMRCKKVDETIETTGFGGFLMQIGLSHLRVSMVASRSHPWAGAHQFFSEGQWTACFFLQDWNHNQNFHPGFSLLQKNPNIFPCVHTEWCQTQT